MKLPTIDEIKNNQTVILRLDLDLPMSDGKIWDNSRLVKSVPTIRQLLAKNSKIIVIGHCGRPRFIETINGEITVDTNSLNFLSLKPVYLELMTLLENDEDSISSVFLNVSTDRELISEAVETNQIVFLENLRFHRQEIEGDVEFFSYLAEIGDVFVNDALAVAHRKSGSVLLYKLMPVYYSQGFAREVEKMTQYFLEPQKPLILVLGGVKEDKLEKLDILSGVADKILVGGKLPTFRDKYKNLNNVIWANLDKTGMDINKESVDTFVGEIGKAGTVILAGTMGKFEDVNHRQGSLAITMSIVNSRAIKIAAGGDTKSSLQEMEMESGFDYICSGGGVALEFLAQKGRLPAWENINLSL